MAILIMSHPAAAVAAGMPAVSVAASATVAGPWYRRSDVLWPLAATLIVLVGYAISIAIWQATHAEPIRVSTEFSAFALLYIATQATERLLEPFASFVMTTGRMKSEMEQSLAGAMTAPEDQERWSQAAEAKGRLDQRQRARAYVMWAAATVIGMIASAALGVYVIAAIAVERGPAVPIDILVTGLVIGGGTKPLHDLIARIERAKQQANAPGSG